ncbi:MAG: hypothetical protein IPO67_31925 [Deltaproteobacteria bacterium]|nr:hypothetical protein [Deltaproteobacteria bacterium]
MKRLKKAIVLCDSFLGESVTPKDTPNGLYRGEAVLRVKGIERGEELLDLL